MSDYTIKINKSWSTQFNRVIIGFVIFFKTIVIVIFKKGAY